MEEAKPFHLEGNFAPVQDEISAENLEVEGAIPPALRGLYLRNGANPVTGYSEHWFLGQGMLHGASAEEPTTQSQVLAVGASCFYLPAKAFYAVFGAATAGLAYGFTFGDEELANKIWVSSVEGNYILTPAMIEGKEPIRFQGP